MPRTLHLRFADRVHAQPTAVAASCGATQLSYGELDAVSNRLARVLRRGGAGPETVVALHLEHGLSSLVAVLATVKAGAALVAVHAADPAARSREILVDSGAQMLVTDRDEPDPPPSVRGVVRLPGDLASLDGDSPAPLEDVGEAGHLFQIVYTSGSTGRPKGVLVPTAAILNRLDAMSARYPFQPGDVALWHRPLSIIGGSWDCLGPLLSGVPTILASPFEPSAPATWGILTGEHVTHLAAAPSLWELVLDQAERCPGEWNSLRLAIIGGQTIDPMLVWRWRRAFPGATLINVYGATECVYPTAYDASALPASAERVPAGLAFPHVEVRVLDDRLQRRTAGAVGEVWIAGPCLARGYLGQPALTAERFVPDPDSALPGAVLFRTGDLGFVDADGLLHVTGRRDRQVKVHGYRVDLGDVEAALRRCERVAHAAVVAKPDDHGDSQLVAYVVATDGAPLSAPVLRATLARGLPRYMLPAFVIDLPEMPRTPGGKVDRQGLPAPSRAALEPAVGQPVAMTPVVACLAAIWREVLGAPTVGPLDNFFDLGGDSLAAMRIAARIREALGVDVEVSLIFDADTIEQLAEAVAAGRSDFVDAH